MAGKIPYVDGLYLKYYSFTKLFMIPFRSMLVITVSRLLKTYLEFCVCFRYQYNTNVVFNPNGTLVARYHKKHLFFEFHYDVPVHTDISYFDTSFGRFGTFVCFDVIFYEPTIELITKHDIDSIVFPTAWMNVLPYFSAVPFHSAFAKGMGVNYLASNLHDPVNRFSGSGIYSYEKVLQFRNNETSEEGALLIDDVPITPVKTQRQNVTFQNLTESEGAFTNEIFGDIWRFVLIPDEVADGEVAVCQNSLCCQRHMNVMFKTMTIPCLRWVFSEVYIQKKAHTT